MIIGRMTTLLSEGGHPQKVRQSRQKQHDREV